MALLSAQSCVPQQLNIGVNGSNRHLRGISKPNSHAGVSARVAGGRHRINAFFNPPDDPIVQKALKEPIAFFGGVFAGLLRLDLKEDPLREWVARTTEAAGLDEDQDPEPKSEEDTTPQQIEIE
uniref:Uncharacterized protein n=1 Tax=Picea sitchensis TaxID=3332 RepID=A9NWH5_PICSI|nr:unknown [Picea sitchensis]